MGLNQLQRFLPCDLGIGLPTCDLGLELPSNYACSFQSFSGREDRNTLCPEMLRLNTFKYRHTSEILCVQFQTDTIN